MTLKIGEAAPLFEVKNDQDANVALSDFKGKNIVLYFYPKDDTPGCTIEAQDFTKKIKDFENLDTVILGVSRDSVKKHCNFIAKYNLAFNLLSDDSEEVCNLYGVMKQKSMFGKKYMGIERSTFLIDKLGKISQIFRSVKVNGHVEEVLASVKKI